MYWRCGGLALLAVSTAIVLVACGGSKSPSVATIATTSTPTTAGGSNSANGVGSSAIRTSKGDANGLLVEWAACMRRNSDPDQADPTIDNHSGINITIPVSAPETLSNEVHGGIAPCNQFLAAASSALRAAHPAPPPPSDNATGVKYAACMRANGVPTYPDPTGSRTNLNGIDMNSPFFISANKLCGKQIGAPAWWINGWGPPGNISVTNIPPGGLPSGPNRPRTNNGGTATTTPSTVTSGVPAAR